MTAGVGYTDGHTGLDGFDGWKIPTGHTAGPGFDSRQLHGGGFDSHSADTGVGSSPTMASGDRVAVEKG